MLLDSCGLEPAALLRAQEKLLVAGRDVVQRPMSGKPPKGAAAFPAEGGGGQSRKSTKSHAERSQALVAYVEADVGDAVIFGKQEFLCFFDAHSGNKLVRSLPECLREQTVEVEWRKAGLTRRLFQRDTVTVAGAYIIARAAEARERGGVEKSTVAPIRHLGASRLSPHSHSMYHKVSLAHGPRNLARGQHQKSWAFPFPLPRASGVARRTHFRYSDLSGAIRRRQADH
jgi:hypothetical protein